MKGMRHSCFQSLTTQLRGLGTRLLANLMLPDGAERQTEDWTIFFLNQTPSNTIAPVLALDTPELRASRIEDEDGKPELLYVLNLVRTKLDKTVRRCVSILLVYSMHPEEHSEGPLSRPWLYALDIRSLRSSRYALTVVTLVGLL